MERVPDLAAKLVMLLKASSLSRVGLAQEVGVDKSLVGRWANGAIHPGEHNLAKLTTIFRKHFPALTLADWYREREALAHRIGIAERNDQITDVVMSADGPFAKIVATSAPEIAYKTQTYEGFWRTTRPSVVMPGELFHDYGMFRANDKGMIDVVMEGAGLTFTGWMFPMAGNLYVFLFDPVGRTPLIVLMKGVTLPRATSIEGLLLLSALDTQRTPAAVPVVLERLGDLSGDRDADDRRLREIIDTQPEPLFPLGEATLRKCCYRDVGPIAANEGGDLYMMVSRALSQGTTSNGLHG
ncbi:XRE family transcriptional regulator [Croceicoccus ponticola]|uniref:XRE family transcriptional regulator n=1 Tax=Croceicoccus ponticola TaxID=2217664 RepID=A0A437H1C0_9SPHN|nr:helix-turn-helix transcriptional regulator [Croceicoccus ponticola]RVQ69431.1 XRE family transcriptional regulator [Croceicoccus ponticola]